MSKDESTRHSSTAFRPDVEGLRAIAILLVALYHGGLPGLTGGFIGVDVFFVLSGYLITGLLVREIESSGSVHFTAFYARRARRLLPAAACVLLVTLLAAQFIYAPQAMITLAKDAVATSAYASNLWFAHIATDYLAADAVKSPLLHTWSLSVEEQFYFVWPLFVLLALRGRKGATPNRRRLLYAMSGLAALSLLLSVLLTDIAQPWAFFSSPARAWEFAIGGLAFFVPVAWMAARPQLRTACFWAGLAALTYSATQFGHHTTFPGVAALLPVLGTSLLLISHAPGQTDFRTRLLHHPLLQWLGGRSYSWYLWHWPVLILAGMLLPEKHLGISMLCLVLSLLLADLSYRWVENPVRFHPRLARQHGYALSLALCLTLASAGTAAWWRHAGTLEAASPTQIRFTQAMDDVPKTIYESNCHLSLLAVETGDCFFGDPEATTTIALFGDSHAAQWFPALEKLARQQHWRLVSLTKSACPVAWLKPVNQQLGRPYEECSRWREQVTEKIIALRPKVVVMGYYRYVSLPDAVQSTISERHWQDAMRETMQRFNDAGIAVAIMRDSPRPGFDVPTCLARQAKTPWLELDCDFSRTLALDSVEYNLNRQAAMDLEQVLFIDLSRRICASEICNPVDSDSGIVLFRDSHHLTTEFVRHMAPDLHRALAGVMGAG